MKQTIIKSIQDFIIKHGMVTSDEIKQECDILYLEDKKNIHLISSYLLNDVEISVYEKSTDNELDGYRVDYKELSNKQLKQILENLKTWEDTWF